MALSDLTLRAVAPVFNRHRVLFMGDVIPFKRKTAWQKHQGKSLCKEGFHKWVVEKANQFDVKKGKLVTHFRCSRCGETKVQAL